MYTSLCMKKYTHINTYVCTYVYAHMFAVTEVTKKKHRYFLMCDGHRLAIILQLTQTPLRNLFCTESSLELRLTNIYFNPFSLGLRLTNIVHNHAQSGSSLPKYYSPRFTRTQI